MTRQQMTNLIGAGTLAALIVAVGLLLGGNRPNAAAQTVSAGVDSAETTSVEALQAENAALHQTVTTLREREAEYAAQIESANQLLAEQAASAAYAGYDEEGDHEEGDHEEGDHEEGDHDEYDHEEHGDYSQANVFGEADDD